ncbi:MarR family winged helix-turn-helix transcriptional regulator [Lacticaseibacillus brantae]|nr:MarR family transcriptional regulator [Lacticaseibacillus brantae]
MVKLKKFKEVFDQLHTDEGADPEKQWLMNHAQSDSTRAAIRNSRNFTHSELAILSTLTEHDDTLAFKLLQEESSLSQGMLSRYVERLANNGLIEKFHTPENQKAVMLRNTTIGHEIGDLHLKLHAAQNRRYKEVLNRYSRSEQETVLAFLNDFAAARQSLE